jgi:hypothetical protein
MTVDFWSAVDALVSGHRIVIDRAAKSRWLASVVAENVIASARSNEY